MKITYTAKRSVIPGHTAGLDYSLEFGARAITPSYAATADTNETLNGTVETLFHREVERWQIEAVSIDPPDQPQWREFIASVRAGEPFAVDLYDDSNEVTAMLDGDPNYTRLAMTTAFNIAFTIRVLNA